MARIQRKKVPARKKKRVGEENASSQVIQGNESVQTESEMEAAATAAERRKKGIQPQKRFGQMEQTAVMRLVDRYVGPWIQFLREVKIELSKVVWPSRNQTIGSTAVVIVFVFLVALFLGIIDLALSSLVRLLI